MKWPSKPSTLSKLVRSGRPTSFRSPCRGSDNGIIAGDPLSIDVLVGSPGRNRRESLRRGYDPVLPTPMPSYLSPSNAGKCSPDMKMYCWSFWSVTSSGVEIFFLLHAHRRSTHPCPASVSWQPLNFTALPDAVSGTYSFSTSAEEAI